MSKLSNKLCPLRGMQICEGGECEWWVKVITWTYPDGSHDYECCCSVKAIAIKENKDDTNRL